MKKFVVIAIVVLVLVALVVWLEPTRTIIGWMRGENFFESRPTQYWAAVLKSDDPNASDDAKDKLRSGGAKAAAVLDEMLRTENSNDAQAAELRWTAADLLGQIGPDAKPYSATLLAALNDPDPYVRSVAAATLPKIDAPADVAVVALVKLLEKDGSVEVARRLSAYGPDAAPALAKLVQVLKNKKLDSEVRWNTARTLGKMRDKGAPAIDALVECLQDEAPTVREHSAEALGDIGPAARESVPALLAILADTVPRVRRDAARSLGQIGDADPTVLQALQQLATDTDEDVRSAADTALKALNADPARRDEGRGA